MNLGKGAFKKTSIFHFFFLRRKKLTRKKDFEIVSYKKALFQYRLSRVPRIERKRENFLLMSLGVMERTIKTPS